MYGGEELTQRGYALRHGWKIHIRTEPSAEEAAGLAERRARLGARTPPRAPMGGVDNGGAYIFALFPENWAEVRRRLAALWPC